MARDMAENIIKSESLIRQQFDELGAVQKGFSKEQMEYVMKTIAPTLNEKEGWLFLLKASKLGLNPLLGELNAYSSTNGRGERQLVIIAGVHGKRRSAENTGNLKSLKTEAIYVKEIILNTEHDGKVSQIVKVNPWEGGRLWGATCTIVRADRPEDPTTVTVPFSEYNRGNSIWKEKPETMIKKVAESQALTEAFPQMNGVYDEAESFSSGPAVQAAPQIEGGEKPMIDVQKQTLMKLGYSDTDLESMNLSRQGAAELIMQKTREKSQKETK
jgi:phage recombination protein Bet